MVRKLEAMPPELKAAYLASGRVTVGHVDQVVKNAEGKNVFKRWYVAKIRGVIVGDNGEWQHETREAALNYGREVLTLWQKEFTGSNKACSGQEPAVALVK
jgi:hypothetical protein